jgi:hypothetical protein
MTVSFRCDTSGDQISTDRTRLEVTSGPGLVSLPTAIETGRSTLPTVPRFPDGVAPVLQDWAELADFRGAIAVGLACDDNQTGPRPTPD